MLSILIVDDDPDDREAVRRSLRHLPDIAMPILEAEDEQECLDHIRGGSHLDCILLDYSIRGRDGLKILQEIRAFNSSIAIVMNTGQGDEHVAVQAMKFGAQDYVSKDSVTPEELARVIRSAVDQIRLQTKEKENADRRHHSLKLEAMGQLTGGVAHDFNNLLAIILGNLELLREDPDVSQMDYYVDEAIAATLRGRELTTSLLSFARKAQLKPVILGLNDVVRRMEGMLRRTLPANIQIFATLSDDLWKVQADRSSLENMILNLVINARDAMPNGGEIRIETANIRLHEEYSEDYNDVVEPGLYVMIAITDTGAGIPPENLKRVFEPFFTTKPIGKGTGLGLSSVMGFARQSKGTVRIYSEVGVGTSLKVYFQAVFKDEQIQTQIMASPRLPSYRGKILLVEDEPAVRKVMKTRLQIEGYSVVEAEDAAIAIRAFEADGPFDLVLTDVVMPGEMQGTGMVATLRKVEPGLNAIFMSGHPNEAANNRNGFRDGDIQLMKPVTKDDLLRALMKVLGALDTGSS